MKERLLVTELWGLGDLAIASEFLRLASQHYEVLLVAKPYAIELGKELWPDVRVIPFTAPWSRFQGKYQLHRWPWGELFSLRKALRDFRPDVAVSARWDPRDHVVLYLSGARQRLGFARTGSQWLLTQALPKIDPDSPRTAQWRAVAKALSLPDPEQAQQRPIAAPKHAVIHSGAAQPVRVWPLSRYRELADGLRERDWSVTLLCDQSQTAAWQDLDQAPVVPTSPGSLIDNLKQGDIFIGNDSGPGHIAAALGIPTFTIFGPQRPEWFLPHHPLAGWQEGKPCPHKPCFDYCRFAEPHCLLGNESDEVKAQLLAWLDGVENPRSGTET